MLVRNRIFENDGIEQGEKATLIRTEFAITLINLVYKLDTIENPV